MRPDSSCASVVAVKLGGYGAGPVDEPKSPREAAAPGRTGEAAINISGRRAHHYSLLLCVVTKALDFMFNLADRSTG
jgi:hypothetical protein